MGLLQGKEYNTTIHTNEQERIALDKIKPPQKTKKLRNETIEGWNMETQF